jgi:putative ABC transport system substrate-binding protein
MRRRHFIPTLACATSLVPVAARAQGDRRPRVGILGSLEPDGEETRLRERAVRDGLRKLGWIDGRNVIIDARSSGGSDRLQATIAELLATRPDVILASATTALAALRRTGTSVPIVFVQVTDPVGTGFVQSLARPGGNITGFTQHEFSICLKWLELLKELAPDTSRVAVLFDPLNPAAAGYLATMQATAAGMDVKILEHAVQQDADIDRATSVAAAGGPGGGLIVLPGPSPSLRRDLVIRLAAERRLPAVYPFLYWATAGGLAFYGVDNIDLHRLAATYLDKILRGEKPADLPVQHATKFELVLNLRTARALGIDPPTALLARADDVIE